MVQGSEIFFSDEFQSPAVKAQLEIFLIFADSVRAQLAPLSEATEREGAPEWHEILDILAAHLAQQLPNVTRIDQATSIWNQFSNDLKLSSLKTYTRVALHGIETRIGTWVAAMHAQKQHSTQYLKWANHSGFRSAEHLAAHQIRLLRVFTLKPLWVRFDPKGEENHASAYRSAGVVHWAFQVQKHSFWGVLVADKVLEHEYFCHMLPINSFLSSEIREGFLDRVLELEHASAALVETTEGYVESRWSFVLQRFRNELSRHFSESASFLQWQFRNLAQALRILNRHCYWRLLREILNAEDDLDLARAIESALRALCDYQVQGRLQDVVGRWAASPDSYKLLDNIGL